MNPLDLPRELTHETSADELLAAVRQPVDGRAASLDCEQRCLVEGGDAIMLGDTGDEVVDGGALRGRQGPGTEDGGGHATDRIKLHPVWSVPWRPSPPTSGGPPSR